MLEKYGKGELKLNPKDISEERSQELRRQKFEGFPCYVVATQWYDDFHSAMRTKQKIGPINNFAVINDIFEAHQYAPEEAHRNCYMFPGDRVEAVSKTHWNFMTAFFNEGAEFVPIKRLSKVDRSSSFNTYNTYGNSYGGGSNSYGHSSYYGGSYNGGFGRSSNTGFGANSSSNWSKEKEYH